MWVSVMGWRGGRRGNDVVDSRLYTDVVSKRRNNRARG